MKETTKRVLAELKEIQGETGLPATVRQLAGKAGYAGPSGVLRHVKALEEGGLLSRVPGVARSIKITPAGEKELQDA